MLTVWKRAEIEGCEADFFLFFGLFFRFFFPLRTSFHFHLFLRQFCHSAILPFCHSAILPFCHSNSRLSALLPFCQMKSLAVFRGPASNFDIQKRNHGSTAQFRLHKMSDVRPDLLDARVTKWGHKQSKDKDALNELK